MDILYANGWFLTRCIATLAFRYQISGQEFIPEKGGFILAVNHISYYDPPLAGSAASRKLYFFAKEELFKNPLFGWILRNVNALPVKRGAFDRRAIQLAIKIIRNGNGLTFFPEGTRSRTGNLLPAKPGLGMVAHHAQCPIVPGNIHGSNRIAACLTGREQLRITFGEPFSAAWVASFDASKEAYLEISRTVLNRIGELGCTGSPEKTVAG
jgi:1-acyl-sn-glycerol-3-phosphate acyltransferase